jgi:glycosyltransferase involved in cell wall biosynthesis
MLNPPAVPRISLVIPAHNEEQYLTRLLDSVDVARARYAHGTDHIEVVVVDDASTDATAQIAEARGCVVVRVEERRIAAARNAGARAARGEILSFIDADSRIHPETFNAIDAELASEAIVGGTTGTRFERSSLGIRCSHGMLLVMGTLLRLIMRERPSHQVDAGVVFCRKDDFDTIGGYNEERSFAEDVQFLMDLSRRGRRKGQRLSRGTGTPAMFSTRKFDKYGDWHFFRAPLWLPWRSLFHPSARNEFTDRYWYGDR